MRLKIKRKYFYLYLPWDNEFGEWLADSSLCYGVIYVEEGDCYIEEGCVSGSGLRRVIRFGTLIINVGNEDQKTGISEDRLENFFNICTKELDLNVIGIMCLPPNDNQSSKYFSKMIQLIKKIKLKETSMGMSNDYLEAVSYQSTYLRIGSKIFGERN